MQTRDHVEYFAINAIVQGVGEAPKQSPSMTHCDLRECLRELCDEINDTLQRRNEVVA
jgi:hypothetical protein